MCIAPAPVKLTKVAIDRIQLVAVRRPAGLVVGARVAGDRVAQRLVHADYDWTWHVTVSRLSTSMKSLMPVVDRGS